MRVGEKTLKDHNKLIEEQAWRLQGCFQYSSNMERSCRMMAKENQSLHQQKATLFQNVWAVKQAVEAVLR